MTAIDPERRIPLHSLGRRIAAECLGTFALVLAGTGAIVVNDQSAGALTHVGVAASFGLAVLILIAAFGEISGAHLNPAVTLGLVVARRFPGRESLTYIPAQLTGAILASGLLLLLCDAHPTYGATIPRGSSFQSLILEFLLTSGLMLVILRMTSGPGKNGWFAAIVIGAVIGLEALVAGPISGASMNPARSLGPAVVAGLWQHLWIYFAGPLLGGLAGVLACRWLSAPDCCGAVRCE